MHLKFVQSERSSETTLTYQRDESPRDCIKKKTQIRFKFFVDQMNIQFRDDLAQVVSIRCYLKIIEDGTESCQLEFQKKNQSHPTITIERRKERKRGDTP